MYEYNLISVSIDNDIVLYSNAHNTIYIQIKNSINKNIKIKNIFYAYNSIGNRNMDEYSSSIHTLPIYPLHISWYRSYMLIITAVDRVYGYNIYNPSVFEFCLFEPFVKKSYLLENKNILMITVDRIIMVNDRNEKEAEIKYEMYYLYVENNNKINNINYVEREFEDKKKIEYIQERNNIVGQVKGIVRDAINRRKNKNYKECNSKKENIVYDEIKPRMYFKTRIFVLCGNKLDILDNRCIVKNTIILKYNIISFKIFNNKIYTLRNNILEGKDYILDIGDIIESEKHAFLRKEGILKDEENKIEENKLENEDKNIVKEENKKEEKTLENKNKTEKETLEDKNKTEKETLNIKKRKRRTKKEMEGERARKLLESEQQPFYKTDINIIEYQNNLKFLPPQHEIIDKNEKNSIILRENQCEEESNIKKVKVLNSNEFKNEEILDFKKQTNNEKFPNGFYNKDDITKKPYNLYSINIDNMFFYNYNYLYKEDSDSYISVSEFTENKLLEEKNDNFSKEIKLSINEYKDYKKQEPSNIDHIQIIKHKNTDNNKKKSLSEEDLRKRFDIKNKEALLNTPNIKENKVIEITKEEKNINTQIINNKSYKEINHNTSENNKNNLEGERLEEKRNQNDNYSLSFINTKNFLTKIKIDFYLSKQYLFLLFYNKDISKIKLLVLNKRNKEIKTIFNVDDCYIDVEKEIIIILKKGKINRIELNEFYKDFTFIQQSIKLEEEYYEYDSSCSGDVYL
ncbi:hypothetical protein SLOPH_845 [Spraguea lophii 42_110]|uniref:Uncharacterized protein n=1 Tax=Spraguea lophii (strain 42_110) TaxID=1358809 RepID=S7W8Q3_SPRLO|nr:hypothetical protein SLOPH_845 [Spraguea lophii 42_110]